MNMLAEFLENCRFEPVLRWKPINTTDTFPFTCLFMKLIHFEQTRHGSLKLLLLMLARKPQHNGVKDLILLNEILKDVSFIKMLCLTLWYACCSLLSNTMHYKFRTSFEEGDQFSSERHSCMTLLCEIFVAIGSHVVSDWSKHSSQYSTVCSCPDFGHFTCDNWCRHLLDALLAITAFPIRVRLFGAIL